MLINHRTKSKGEEILPTKERPISHVQCSYLNILQRVIDINSIKHIIFFKWNAFNTHPFIVIYTMYVFFFMLIPYFRYNPMFYSWQVCPQSIETIVEISIVSENYLVKYIHVNQQFLFKFAQVLVLYNPSRHNCYLDKCWVSIFVVCNKTDRCEPNRLLLLNYLVKYIHVNQYLELAFEMYTHFDRMSKMLCLWLPIKSLRVL